MKRYKNTKYLIDPDGTCYSELSHKFLIPQTNSKYPTYNLTIDGKRKKVKVHRMVAETFLDKPVDCDIVNHIDGNTQNFALSNLEWTTPRGNSQHALAFGLKKITTNVQPIYYLPNEIPEERWVEIKDYPLYLVSDQGRVMNKKTKRILRTYSTNVGGYEGVSLWKEGKGKTFQIQRIVYSSFTQDYELQGFVINHKDGGKKNNKLNNLEKITYRENNLHAEYIIKTHNCAKPVIQLDGNKNPLQTFPSVAAAQRALNIKNISRAALKGCRAGGYYWKYQ